MQHSDLGLFLQRGLGEAHARTAAVLVNDVYAAGIEASPHHFELCAMRLAEGPIAPSGRPARASRQRLNRAWCAKLLSSIPPLSLPPARASALHFPGEIRSRQLPARSERGEAQPENLTGIFIVQLGVAAEAIYGALLAILGAAFKARSSARNERRLFQASVFRPRVGLRRSTPTPPPFSEMNAIPAASNAERSFSTVEILASRPVSNRFLITRLRQP